MKRGMVGVAAAALLLVLAAASCGRRPVTTAQPQATARPKATAQPAATPAPTSQIAWGEAVDGIQVGLEAPRRIFQTNETIAFTIHVRNLGRQEVTLHHAGAAVDWHPRLTPVNGEPAYEVLYRPLMAMRRNPPSLTLAGGEEKTLAVEISQGGNFSFYRRGEDHTKGLRALPPGRYQLISWNYVASGTKVISSAPIEIEIVAPGAAAKAKPLTEAEARALATKLANEELAKGNVRDNRGQPVLDTFQSESWSSVWQREGMWRLSIGSPQTESGVCAAVSFRLDGSEPQVQVYYATKGG